jgi:hypothetical protein
MFVGTGKYVPGGASSYEVVGTPPLIPRLSLILKSCFSISNSETAFFFMRSRMAFMSFRSTVSVSLQPDFCSHYLTLGESMKQKSSSRSSTLLNAVNSIGSENNQSNPRLSRGHGTHFRKCHLEGQKTGQKLTITPMNSSKLTLMYDSGRFYGTGGVGKPNDELICFSLSRFWGAGRTREISEQPTEESESRPSQSRNV